MTDTGNIPSQEQFERAIAEGHGILVAHVHRGQPFNVRPVQYWHVQFNNYVYCVSPDTMQLLIESKWRKDENNS